MKFKIFLISIFSMVWLSACATSSQFEALETQMGQEEHYRAVLNKQLSSDQFSDWLAKDYRALSIYENKEMFDYTDADYFASKSLAAARGASVMPANPEARDIDIRFLEEAQSGYQNVMDAYAQKKDVYYPKQMARLQIAYDCWLEQVEEGHQINHILQCKEMFYAALADMQGISSTVIVYFEHDSFDIVPGEAQKLDAVVSNFRVNRKKISIEGHTDSTGTANYNEKLSEQRAQIVADYVGPALIEFDRDLVLDSVISIQGVGETRLAVPTGDNVNEPRNRRAIVHFK